jgi:hypothetical protein
MPISAIPVIHLGEKRDLANHKHLQYRLQRSNGFPLPSFLPCHSFSDGRSTAKGKSSQRSLRLCGEDKMGK